MTIAFFQFYDELNYFLPAARKETSFSHKFKERASIKDAIESLGVPHPEVNSIVVNGKGVDFSYLIEDGDRISVYPVSKSDPPTVLLRPPYPQVPRFLLDVHLGKLTSFLRMLGFDSWYRNDYEDEELARISAEETRILLTRDLGLLKRSIVTYGYYIRATEPETQVRELLQRYDLFNLVQLCGRCVSCNGLLQPVEKELILHRLLPQTKEEIDEFKICGECAKIYWQGSHYDKIQEFVRRVC